MGVAFVAIIAAAIVFVTLRSENEGEGDAKVQKGLTSRHVFTNKTGKDVRRGPKRGTRRGGTRINEPERKLSGAGLFALEKDEEDLLTAVQKELLAELRALSDAEDRKGLYRLIAKMQKSDEWPDGIPSCLHMAAIEALRWIGSDAMAELVSYLGCGDGEVREEAMDALQEMLCDPDKSDFDRSDLLKSSLGYLNTLADAEVLDDIFSDIMEMRNSVKADTIIYLLENGSDMVREALKDTIELVTGEDDYNSVEKMKQWAADPENQDDPDDNEFYGGSNDDPDRDDTDDDINKDTDYGGGTTTGTATGGNGQTPASPAVR